MHRLVKHYTLLKCPEDLALWVLFIIEIVYEKTNKPISDFQHGIYAKQSDLTFLFIEKTKKLQIVVPLAKKYIIWRKR